MDDALHATGKWDYSGRYGIQFFVHYKDRHLFEPVYKNPELLLLKPHGSINWFRYKDIPWDDNSYHTLETLTMEEIEGTGLFLFLDLKDHPINMRLGARHDFEPKLKQPPELDIVPPGERSANRRNFALIKEQMMKVIARPYSCRFLHQTSIINDGDSWNEGHRKTSFRSNSLCASSKLLI
jgi:hypothetical protein